MVRVFDEEVLRSLSQPFESRAASLLGRLVLLFREQWE